MEENGMTDEQIRVTAKVLQGLQQCGDLSTVVTIDPATKRISRISLPLTDQLRSLALTLVDEYGRSDADKAVAQSFIKLSEVSLTIDCTALPQGTTLTVPEKSSKRLNKCKIFMKSKTFHKKENRLLTESRK